MEQWVLHFVYKVTTWRLVEVGWFRSCLLLPKSVKPGSVQTYCQIYGTKFELSSALWHDAYYHAKIAVILHAQTAHTHSDLTARIDISYLLRCFSAGTSHLNRSFTVQGVSICRAVAHGMDYESVLKYSNQPMWHHHQSDSFSLRLMFVVFLTWSSWPVCA